MPVGTSFGINRCQVLLWLQAPRWRSLLISVPVLSGVPVTLYFAKARGPGQGDVSHKSAGALGYLRYQLRLVRRAWPEALGALETVADDLGQLLGDEHDLSVIRARVTDEPSIATKHRLELVELIDLRSDDLRTHARKLGEQLYDDKPADFVRRLGILWRAAA
jgi:hypothetical protein